MSDRDGLSPIEREFATALWTRSAEGKSKKPNSHRLDISAVKEVYRSVYRPRGEQEYEPQALLDCLRRLQRHHVLRVTRRNDGERIPLPIAIQVFRQPEPKEDPLPLPPLVEQLSWLVTRWHRLKPLHQAVYTAVNEWLLNNPNPVLAPECERALEIFGKRKYTRWFPEPEKALNGRSFSFQPYFHDREETRRLLFICESRPPLLTERYFGKSEESGFARMGAGNILMVVENHTTCWSLAESMGDLDHGLKHLAWGIGNSFVRSVGSIRPDHEVDTIRYFGDVDATGLSIPWRANSTANEGKLPEVEPAVELYDALFRMGTPLPGKEEPVSREKAERLAAWLPQQYHEQTIELLMRGERLAQEWVNLQYLRSAEDWHTSVR
ncbi:hypothetical protein [Streptomyces sp. CC208A]|uniref:hypothetical protein n=1 Tax=Streptomyces sp. CC208A TaxID=3044573 RepID=UPI0024A9D8C1|nr:hypothetical protein [Streptomyces sp. CC208A]